MDIYVYSAVAWFFAGLVNGITGFGAALVAMPILTSGLDVSVALPCCTFVVLLANVQMSLKYRGFRDWTRIRILSIGAIPGVITGITLFYYLPELAMRIWFGLFLILYSIWGLFFNTKIQKIISAKWGYLAGFFSTAFGTTLGFNAPPFVIYSSLSGLDKNTLKSAIGVFSVITGVVIVFTQAVAGLFNNKDVFLASSVGVPAVFIGGLIGIYIAKYISEVFFRKILYVSLNILGLAIIYKAVGSLL